VTATSWLRARLHRAGGSVGVELALGVAVLVLPVALAVVVLPTWAERQSMARLAAQEMARTVVLSGDLTTGTAQGELLAQRIAANHGMAGAVRSVSVTTSGASLTRGATVTAAVEVSIPVPALPWISGGDLTWTVTHAEVVDPYRSGSWRPPTLHAAATERGDAPSRRHRM